VSEEEEDEMEEEKTRRLTQHVLLSILWYNIKLTELDRKRSTHLSERGGKLAAQHIHFSARKTATLGLRRGAVEGLVINVVVIIIVVRRH
jgi:hypothetical protein